MELQNALKRDPPAIEAMEPPSDLTTIISTNPTDPMRFKTGDGVLLLDRKHGTIYVGSHDSNLRKQT